MPRTRPAPRPTVPARPARMAGTWVLAVVFALLVMVFFNEVLLQGKSFGSPDAQAPAGFGRIGAESLAKDHVYPLWNPYVFLGMPSFASGSYNPHIYPPDWPLTVIAKVIPLPDLTWLILYYFLAAVFTALLAREWGARPEGALLAGVLFAFTPNLVAVGTHGHGSQLVDSAYLPLLVWLAARWLRRGGLQHLGWLAVAGGFQMLRGHAQIVYYTWLAVGLYTAIELIAGFVRRDGMPTPVRLARAGGVIVAMLLAFGLAGFYNLPLRDYAKHSIRGGGSDGGVGMDYATSWSMAPYETPTLVIPNAVGFGDETYWGAMPFTSYPNPYVGVVAVALAVPAVLGEGVPGVFALVLGVFALLVSFGEHAPLYGLLYKYLPLFNKFRVPVMIVLLLHLAMALALAWGWTRVLTAAAEEPPKDRSAPRSMLDRLLIGLLGLFALVLVVAVVGQGALRQGYVAAALAHRPGFPQAAAEAGAAAYTGDLVRAGLMGLLATGLLVMVRRRVMPATLATGLALVLLLFDTWPIGRRVMDPVIADPVVNTVEVGRDDVVNYLEPLAKKDLFRIAAIEDFRSNRFTGFGIQTVGGYHAAKPRLIQDLFDRGGQSAPWGAAYTPGWLALLNTRYIVTDQNLDGTGFPLAFQGQKGRVYALPFSLPRAMLLGRYRVAPFDSTFIDSVAAGRLDVGQVVTLDKDPHLTLGSVAGAHANVTAYRLNDVSVQVDTPGPALLRLADLWYPDWHATVDGRSAPILRADYLLRAVPVPAGRHTVVFRFQPAAVRTGLMLSLVSFVVALLLIVAGTLRGRAPVARKGAEAA